ncbi:hypothetical protein SDC9_115918 [bioreactor metagenome]|uniref:Uncharacterized protein n=1 Tax=bioreactor metagenome TaxID=1076179 RepID=A0A645BWG9_9ZZZZ
MTGEVNRGRAKAGCLEICHGGVDALAEGLFHILRKKRERCIQTDRGLLIQSDDEEMVGDDRCYLGPSVDSHPLLTLLFHIGFCLEVGEQEREDVGIGGKGATLHRRLQLLHGIKTEGVDFLVRCLVPLFSHKVGILEVIELTPELLNATCCNQ